MTTTITDGTSVITPDLVLGYETDNDATNIFHEILGRADYDVSVAPDRLRSGELLLFFEAEADAKSAREFHLAAVRFTLATDDLTLMDMTYVRRGGMRLALDSETRTRWTLTVGYQEVTA